jgi:uncharacterized protein (UPF0248 family)
MKTSWRSKIVLSSSLFAMFVVAWASGFSVRSTTTFVTSNTRRRVARLSHRWLTSNNMSATGNNELSMENLYREWSLEQDRLLLDNKDLSSIELASLLGRGLRGVEARLSKLQDVSSPAYERLFADKRNNSGDDDGDVSSESSKEKLVPVSEVLRRIEWDYMLQASDFSILHYDRLEDKTVQSPMDAPNNSISGGETLLTKALPEHRIVGVKFKERIVWDRNARMDLVFSPPGIYEVMETYDEWKLERDRVQAWNRERQLVVAERIKSILGLECYGRLQQLSSDLLQAEQDPAESTRAGAESYVRQALELFREVRNDPTLSSDPMSIPTGDYYALDELSELVAVLPNVELRTMLLSEISLAMTRAEGKAKRKNNSVEQQSQVDVDLVEEDLTETFVRGSGAGGQKINKTSNRVLLVHEPTQLRVECQDTRSLQQNRKIARKRLKEKLDDYLNGSQSKLGMKQQKVSKKKKKSKTKNKARLQKKQLEKQQQEQSPQNGEDSNAKDPYDNDDFY